MVVTIYVDFRNERVYTEKEYEEAVKKRVQDGLDGCSEYGWNFDEWLNDDGYTPADIFYMTEEEKQNVIERYKDYAEEVILSEWDCTKEEIEI